MFVVGQAAAASGCWWNHVLSQAQRVFFFSKNRADPLKELWVFVRYFSRSLFRAFVVAVPPSRS